MKTALNLLILVLLTGLQTVNGQCPTPPATVYGTSQIYAQVLGSTLTISTSNAFAGAITSLNWRQTEFVDTADHGREFQTAIFPQPAADAKQADWVECYNPTEAGNKTDVSTSSSKLTFLSASGNVLRTSTQMAFYVPPDGRTTGYCGDHGTVQSHNQCVLSNYVLDKTVTIGFAGIPNVIEYVATVHIPESLARASIVTPIHAPRSFDLEQDFSVRAKSFIGSPIFPSNNMLQSNETNNPVSLFKSSAGVGMAIYSPECLQLYNHYVPGAIVNPYHEWVMTAIGGYPATSYQFGAFPMQAVPMNASVTRRTYVVMGTYNEMASALNQLHYYYRDFDPDVFDWSRYLARYPDVAAYYHDQIGAEYHWTTFGIHEGRAGSDNFSPALYLQKYPTVAASCGGTTNYQCAIDDFVASGRSLGRSAKPTP